MSRLVLCCLAALVAVPGSDNATLDERRQHVAQLSDSEKAELARRFREFSELAENERHNLRRLHAQVQADREAARLQATMKRYCRWLENLPPFRRAELMGLEPDERVKRVKSILEDQAKWEAKRPASQDLAALTRWLEQSVARHEAEVVRSMPEIHRRRLNETNAAQRKRLLIWWRWQAVSAGVLQPSNATEFAELLRSLSPETRAKLESKPLAEQARVVGGWLRYTTVGTGLKGGMRAVDDRQLSYFFEHDLSDEQRDRLLSLPAEQMHRELLRLYHGPHGKPGDPPERRADRGPKRSLSESLAPRRKPAGSVEPKTDRDKARRAPPSR